MADGSVIIDTKLDNSGLEKGLKDVKNESKKAEKSVESFGDSFKEAERQSKRSTDSIKDDLGDVKLSLNDIASVVGVSFGIDQLIEFGGAAIETASDLQEVQNVVDTAFGDMSYQVDEFASKSIESFGMSELAAKQTAGQYMAMTTAMGLSGQAATDMSLSVTALTGDMASFYNVSQDVARTALASIWTGETESLKQFGIVMTQTNLEAFALSQGINKTWQEMTQAEQVQLRYNYVMQQTNLAQGDFLKTQDSWANQSRILDENLKSLQGTVGEGLMSALSPLLEIVNGIISGILQFQESTGILDEFFSVLIGGISGLLALKAIEVIKGLAAVLLSVGESGMIAQMQMGLAAAAIGTLVMLILKLSDAWWAMTDAEKVVSVLGAVGVAALAAAVAVGAFQSAVSLGLAAAGIVAGVAAIMASINSAQQRIQKFESSKSKLPNLSKGGGNNIPQLATGAVIPPNRRFMAVLGDQTNGTNLEAPEGLIRQIVREESGGGVGGTLRISPAPGLTRYLRYELEVDKNRAGEPLVEGVRR